MYICHLHSQSLVVFHLYANLVSTVGHDRQHDGKALGVLGYHLSTHEIYMGTCVLFNIGFLCGVYTMVSCS